MIIPHQTRITVLILLLLFISMYFILGIDGYFTIDMIKQLKAEISAYRYAYPFRTAAIFVLIYVAATGLSLPVAGILSITGGALFGLLWGTLIVIIAGTLGASGAFVLSRYLFREAIQERYGEKLAAINSGIKRNGMIYLFSLRLIPVIPYFIINAVMGITPMPLLSFISVTLIGMLPVTTLLVNGGTQIATLNSVQDIMSLKVVFSFILIGMIPIIAHVFSSHLMTKDKA